MSSTAIEVFPTGSYSIASDKQLLDSNLKDDISIELQLTLPNKTHISIVGDITVTARDAERDSELLYFNLTYLEVDLSGNRNFTEITCSVVNETSNYVGPDANEIHLSIRLSVCYKSAKTLSCLKLLEIPRYYKESSEFFIEMPPVVSYEINSYLLSENTIEMERYPSNIGIYSIKVTVDYMNRFKDTSSLPPNATKEAPTEPTTKTDSDQRSCSDIDGEVRWIQFGLNVILCFALCCLVCLCVITCQRKQQSHRNRLDLQQAPQRHLDAQPCVMKHNLNVQHKQIQPNVNVGQPGTNLCATQRQTRLVPERIRGKTERIASDSICIAMDLGSSCHGYAFVITMDGRVIRRTSEYKHVTDFKEHQQLSLGFHEFRRNKSFFGLEAKTLLDRYLSEPVKAGEKFSLHLKVAIWIFIC